MPRYRYKLFEFMALASHINHKGEGYYCIETNVGHFQSQIGSWRIQSQIDSGHYILHMKLRFFTPTIIFSVQCLK